MTENEITGDILDKEGFLRFVNNYPENNLCASASLRENNSPKPIRSYQ